jgi:phosphatidyl-myo-inositol dimannoside synthase
MLHASVTDVSFATVRIACIVQAQVRLGRGTRPHSTELASLVFVTQDFAPAIGGIETYAFELAQRLARRARCFVLLAPDAPGARAFDRGLPFEVVRVPGSSATMPVASIPVLLTLLRAGGFTLALHAQWSTALGSWLARNRGMIQRYYVAAHGRELLLDPYAGPLGHAYRSCRAAILSEANACLPVSRYTAGLLRQIGVPASRVHLLHNGVDTVRFTAQGRGRALRRRWGLEGRRVLLSVCRLLPHKGIDDVLRALPAVRAQLPDVHYVVAGSGPDESRLRSLSTQLGLDAAVRFEGSVLPDALPDYYAAADLFMLMSRELPPAVEGFGLVLLEAASCGRPAIAARSGGIPDAIVDGVTGVLVEPGDPCGLARALIELLSQPARLERMGELARQRVEQNLSWDHVFDRLCAALASAEPEAQVGLDANGSAA